MNSGVESTHYPAVIMPATNARPVPNGLNTGGSEHDNRLSVNSQARHQQAWNPLRPVDSRAAFGHGVAATGTGSIRPGSWNTTPTVQNSVHQTPVHNATANGRHGLADKSASAVEENLYHGDNSLRRHSSQSTSDLLVRSKSASVSQGKQTSSHADPSGDVPGHPMHGAVRKSMTRSLNIRRHATTESLSVKRPASYPSLRSVHQPSSKESHAGIPESLAHGLVQEKPTYASQFRHGTVLDKQHAAQSAHVPHTAFANTLVSPPPTTLPSTKEVAQVTSRQHPQHAPQHMIIRL